MNSLSPVAQPAALNPRMLTHFRWWKSLIDWGDTLPYVSRFEPELKHELEPHLILMERLPNGSFQLRFAGEHVAAYLVGLTALDDYLDRFNDQDGDTMGAHMSAITGRRCGGLMKRKVYLVDGRVVLATHLGLPFKSDDGLVRHVGSVAEIQELPAGGRRLAKARHEVIDLGYIDLGFGTPEAWPVTKLED